MTIRPLFRIGTGNTSDPIVSAAGKISGNTLRTEPLTVNEAQAVLTAIEDSRSIGFWQKTSLVLSLSTVILLGTMNKGCEREQRLADQLDLQRIVLISDANQDGVIDQRELNTAMDKYLERFPEEERERRLKEAKQALRINGLPELADALEIGKAY